MGRIMIVGESSSLRRGPDRLEAYPTSFPLVAKLVVYQ